MVAVLLLDEWLDVRTLHLNIRITREAVPRASHKSRAKMANMFCASMVGEDVILTTNWTISSIMMMVVIINDVG